MADRITELNVTQILCGTLKQVTSLTAPGAAVSWPRALPRDRARARPVIFRQSQMVHLF